MSTVLVLGKGGREHAIVKCLACSHKVRKILVSPGHYGTLKEPRTQNIKMNIDDFPVDLVVVGSEDYLAKGVADECAKKGIPCFGPVAKCARIETSKSYGKWIMGTLGIPTAKYTGLNYDYDNNYQI